MLKQPANRFRTRHPQPPRKSFILPRARGPSADTPQAIDGEPSGHLPTAKLRGEEAIALAVDELDNEPEDDDRRPSNTSIVRHGLSKLETERT